MVNSGAHVELLGRKICHFFLGEVPSVYRTSKELSSCSSKNHFLGGDIVYVTEIYIRIRTCSFESHKKAAPVLDRRVYEHAAKLTR